jgi:hypothetical protein
LSPINDTPTEADIARLASVADDVLRNLGITQCYHDISLAMRRHTGAGANWCGFATWASKQAGHTIRREDLADAVRTQLQASSVLDVNLAAIAHALRRSGLVRGARSILDAVIRALEAEATFERASKAVALGNRRVFEEIAPLFARFHGTFDGGQPDAGRFTAFTATIRPGDPPAGQTLLREAFERYRDAIAGTETKTKAENLYHANLLIGLHEQTRLQPQIEAALDAPFDVTAVRRRLLIEFLPGVWLRLRYRIAAWAGRRPPLDDAIDALLRGIQEEMRRIITAMAMSLNLPEGRVIRLGRDLDAAYPPALATLTSPSLVRLLGGIDPSPGTPAGSGAVDWADLSDRLHLIAELFRCYHEWEPLFEPPFTARQVEAVRAGRRPSGAL